MALPFPKSARLRSSKDFPRVLADGRSRRDERLKVTARANGLPHTRMGLAVGRRAGNAAQRNRLKRLVREAFRLSWKELPEGYDLVVSAQAGNWTQAQVSESLVRLVREAAGS